MTFLENAKNLPLLNALVCADYAKLKVAWPSGSGGLGERASGKGRFCGKLT